MLELHEAEENWLEVGPEQLVCRRCMWWVSLRGAPDVEPETTVTVHIPPSNRLTVEALTDIADILSRREWIDHVSR